MGQETGVAVAGVTIARSRTRTVSRFIQSRLFQNRFRSLISGYEHSVGSFVTSISLLLRTSIIPFVIFCTSFSIILSVTDLSYVYSDLIG